MVIYYLLEQLYSDIFSGLHYRKHLYISVNSLYVFAFNFLIIAQYCTAISPFGIEKSILEKIGKMEAKI